MHVDRGCFDPHKIFIVIEKKIELYLAFFILVGLSSIFLVNGHNLFQYPRVSPLF